MKRDALQDAFLAHTKHANRIVRAQDGQVVVHELEDCEPMLEAAKRLSQMEPEKEPFRHAAYIPRHVINRAYREGWINDEQAWKRWANDPANKRFRTWEGRL